jgi:mannosylglycoprotein endo-beta-mannosidase
MVFLFSLQPVNVVDPHLVSTFHDDFKRSYLHCTLQLENKGSWAADCQLKIQVSTELEGNICLVEHLQSYAVTVPPHADQEYTIHPVSSFLRKHYLVNFFLS